MSGGRRSGLRRAAVALAPGPVLMGATSFNWVLELVRAYVVPGARARAGGRRTTRTSGGGEGR